MTDTPKRGGWRNPASAENGRKSTTGGRLPAIATALICEGDGIMVSVVSPNGTADIGRGLAVVEKYGRSRLIRLPMANGEEIRILVVK